MTSKSSITPEVLDQLLANYERPEDLIGEAGLFKQLKKALIERALGAELTEHLGYEKGDPAGHQRDLTSRGRRADRKIVEYGKCAVSLPRIRAVSLRRILITQ